MLLEFRVVFSARPVLFGFGTLGWHGFGAFRLTVFSVHCVEFRCEFRRKATDGSHAGVPKPYKPCNPKLV